MGGSWKISLILSSLIARSTHAQRMESDSGICIGNKASLTTAPVQDLALNKKSAFTLPEDVTALFQTSTRVMQRAGADHKITLADQLIAKHQALHIQPSMHPAVDTIDYSIMLPDVNTHFASYAPEHDCNQAFINPSFIKKNEEEMWMAVRILKLCRSIASWNYTHWYNQLAFGSILISDMKEGNSGWNFTSFQLLGHQDDPRKHNEMTTECVAQPLCYTMGPEDPQLFTINGQTYVMFVASDFVKPLLGSGEEEICGVSNMHCRPRCSKHGLHPHIAPVYAVYPELKIGASFPAQVEGGGWIDKNWGLFPFAVPGSQEKLLGVYWIHPHIIIELDMTTGKGTHVYETKSPWTEQLAKEIHIQPDDFHGGPAPQFLEQCPLKNSSSCYLGILHALREVPGWGSETLGNWPYLFLGKPPFEIISIGKKLALTHSKLIQFVSSIILDGENLKLAYNVDNAESRLHVTALNKFMTTYF